MRVTACFGALRHGTVLVLVLVVAVAGSALAHPGDPPRPGHLWLLEEWPLDPFVLLGLVVTALLYAIGTIRVRARAGGLRGVRRWRPLSFAAGWLVLVVALVTPLHTLGESLFSAHMTQHMLVLLVATPLLVLGDPLVSFLWALPKSARRATGRLLRRPEVRRPWRLLTQPASVWLLHALALWVWHAPALYNATLDDDVIHAAQHTSFLAAGLLFWHVVARAAARPQHAGVALLYVFTTAAHASLLGALLTFSRAPLYRVYEGRTERFGLTLLEDHQLGGMIMWIPGGVVYVIAALVLLSRILGTLESANRGPVPRAWPPACRAEAPSWEAMK